MEVAVSSSSDSLLVWDIRTGAILHSVKTTNVLALDVLHSVNSPNLLTSDYILASQQKSALIHVASFQKQAILAKWVLPENFTCLKFSNSAMYCACGGQSGRIYLYHVPTGRLLKFWDAHYQSVSCLNWAMDDSFLFSGGTDSQVYAFRLLDMIHDSKSGDSCSTAIDFISFSGHSLPITGLKSSYTTASSMKLFTSSLDKFLKIWTFDERADSKSSHQSAVSCMASIMFPSQITAITINVSETIAFVGCSNGSIYALHLYGPQAAAGLVTDAESQLFLSHKLEITGLELSLDESLLISSSMDSKCIVWDTQTRQVLVTFNQHKSPILKSSLKVIMQPGQIIQPHQKFKLPECWKKFPEPFICPDIMLSPFNSDIPDSMNGFDTLKKVDVDSFNTDQNENSQKLLGRISELSKANQVLFDAALKLL